MLVQISLLIKNRQPSFLYEQSNNMQSVIILGKYKRLVTLKKNTWMDIYSLNQTKDGYIINLENNQPRYSDLLSQILFIRNIWVNKNLHIMV